MASELLEFENTVEDEHGTSYVARVMGAERDDSKWVGWLEFTPVDGGAALATDRETTQPNRLDLVYWSSGLTYFYLEGALARAKRRQERAEAGDGRAAGAGQEAGSEAKPRIPSRGVPRLEVESPDPKLPDHVLEAVEPRPGTMREVPDAGIVVYEGVMEGDGFTRHVFAVQYGSRNAGAALANWLWSRLHGEGGTVRVDGREVELTNDALRDALVGPTP